MMNSLNHANYQEKYVVMVFSRTVVVIRKDNVAFSRFLNVVVIALNIQQQVIFHEYTVISANLMTTIDLTAVKK